MFAVGISANPQVRWAAGYRSAPTNISREQLMRGGHYYSKQPAPRAFNSVPRPNPPPDNTSPGQCWPCTDCKATTAHIQGWAI